MDGGRVGRVSHPQQDGSMSYRNQPLSSRQEHTTKNIREDGVETQTAVRVFELNAQKSESIEGKSAQLEIEPARGGLNDSDGIVETQYRVRFLTGIQVVNPNA